MTDKVIENNQVTVMGEVVSDFSYSHEIYGEGFYMVDIKCTRLSDSFDIIPVMVSERLLDVTASWQHRRQQSSSADCGNWDFRHCCYRTTRSPA